LAQVLKQRRRRALIIAIGVVVVIAVILSALSGFYLDLLWFREVHFAGVFWSVFWSKVVLGLIFGFAFFAILLINLLIVRQITPRYRPFSPEQEVIERYRAAVEPYVTRIIPAFSALIALFVGIGASSQWQTFVLWRSAGPVKFGPQFMDPVFHRDPSFYLFALPFQKFVQGWLFSALVGITVIVAIAHYLSGGIRLQTVGEKVIPQVKAHMSVLLGLIVLVKAWGYYLGKFDLVISERGVVTGASYTDIHAQLPALRLLVFIAIVCAILFLVNIRFRGWALPGFGLGLLLLTSIVAGAIVPAFVQKFQVQPQELQKESPYIKRNIVGTRYAFGIDIQPTDTNPTSDITAEQVAANDVTISNIRLWRPDILAQTYQALQRIQQYYEFRDVDVDRYIIGGAERMVMLSVREVSQNGIPGTPGWQQLHLIFTHGYGAVASQVNSADASGAPNFLLQNIPPVGNAIQLEATPPNDHGSQVYYGEVADVPYVVVGTNQDELNYPNPSGQGTVPTRYAGKGGISLGSKWSFRRLLFAYRYRDINLLISNLITGDSKILINRNLQTRVTKAAPFLKFDRDPYAAIVDGKIEFIWDAYTSTNLYPYSDQVPLSVATNLDIFGQVNYIRNSVKVVVNAYDGTVTYYVVDPTDPIIKVWQRAFPHLFTPVSQAPPELVAHFRYPEDLLQAQAFEFARYHVEDVPTFFNNTKRWAIPAALPPRVGASGTGTLRPYYVLLKLPGTQQEQFVLFEPFTPAGRQNMVAYMAAGSDPGNYGELSAYQFPTGENVDGPQQVRNLISQDPAASQQITLLSQRGSDVLFGDLIVVPVEDGFLYVQPIFLTAAGQTQPIPELKRVIVVHGGNVSIATSLPEALAASFGQTVTPPSGGPSGPPPTGKVAQLLAQALQHFTAAEAALKAGDLATYQKEINLAQQLVQQAQAAAAQPSPSPSPSPSVSPSPSPTG
jgi:uncharacterized membrane protein (UPF0182 family)